MDLFTKLASTITEVTLTYQQYKCVDLIGIILYFSRVELTWPAVTHEKFEASIQPFSNWHIFDLLLCFSTLIVLGYQVYCYVSLDIL